MSEPTPSTSLEQMESRLAELELKIGGAAFASSREAGTALDVNSRLDKLMRLDSDRRPPPSSLSSAGKPPTAAKAGSKRLALHEEFRTIDRLLSELAMSPVAGPTAAAGANSNAPMVFRRLEILASAESLKRDMDLLAKIRDLTLIGTKATVPGGVGHVSESSIVNCPIVSSERYNLPSDPEAAERLDRLRFRVAKLNQRTAMVSKRADEMINTYGNIMMALSEKMVLAEEQIKE
ncbi:hypothetical protein ACHAWF_005790 [Thalassiosira exigua]